MKPNDSLQTKPVAPKDYKYRTTLLNKGKLAPPGCTWLRLDIATQTDKGTFFMPIPSKLTPEQREVCAEYLRAKVRAGTGR